MLTLLKILTNFSFFLFQSPFILKYNTINKPDLNFTKKIPKYLCRTNCSKLISLNTLLFQCTYV